ncbi:MAG: DUF1599 domain-containing protein [Bacteroidia bacterium]|nr:DUF1599 domain-containing protein [Bacteroidia bacterium]MDW8235768.1 DUF1599 domain-containing protein [Bacteroidia bacterium]
MLLSDYEKWQEQALSIFHQKQTQYGESWEVLSLPSLIDLLTIKAQRIHTLMKQTTPQTGEPPLQDWLALINYATLTLLRLRGNSEPTALVLPKILSEAAQLLQRKNADYGDAWQTMRPLAFIEFILMKLLRIRHMDSQPEAHRQAIEDNLFDIINYALLYLSRYENSATTA